MNDYEKREQEKLNIQKAQLVAQSVTAWETRKNAENTKKIAEEAERSRKINEAEARREALHRREMAARQEEILEDQKTTNFRQTILTTLPLLGNEEKNQYVIEQLMPKVIERRRRNGVLFEDVVKMFGFPEFVVSFSANPEVEQFLIEDKKQKNELISAVQAYIDAKKSSNIEVIALGITLAISILPFIFWVCAPPWDWVIFIKLLGLGVFFIIVFIVVFALLERTHHFKPLIDKIKALKADAKMKKDAYDLHPAKYNAAWNKIKTDLVDSYLASDSGQKFLKSEMTFLPESSWTKAVSDEQVFLPPSARPQSDAWGVALASQIQGELELAKQRQSKIREILLSRICLIDSNDESSGEIGLYETQAFGLREIDKEFIELDLCRPSDEPILPNEAGFQKGRIFLEAVKLQTDG